MKFAKYVIPAKCDIPVADAIRRELEQELVPEWRAKYLDYKVSPKVFFCCITMQDVALISLHLDREEESQSHHARPTEVPSQSPDPILSPAHSAKSRRCSV